MLGDKALATAEKIGEFRVLLLGLSLMLFVDLFCVTVLKTSLMTSTAEELKGLLGLPEIVFLLCAYSLFRAVFVPVVFALLGLASALLISHHSRWRDRLLEDYLPSEEVENYVLFHGNSAAHSELQNMRESQKADARLGQLATGLGVVFLAEIAISAGGTPTALAEIASRVAQLGAPVREIAFATILVFLIWTSIVPVIGWLSSSAFLPVRNMALKNAIKEAQTKDESVHTSRKSKQNLGRATALRVDNPEESPSTNDGLASLTDEQSEQSPNTATPAHSAPLLRSSAGR